MEKILTAQDNETLDEQIKAELLVMQTLDIKNVTGYQVRAILGALRPQLIEAEWAFRVAHIVRNNDQPLSDEAITSLRTAKLSPFVAYEGKLMPHVDENIMVKQSRHKYVIDIKSESTAAIITYIRFQERGNLNQYSQGNYDQAHDGLYRFNPELDRYEKFMHQDQSGNMVWMRSCAGKDQNLHVSSTHHPLGGVVSPDAVNLGEYESKNI